MFDTEPTTTVLIHVTEDGDDIVARCCTVRGGVHKAFEARINLPMLEHVLLAHRPDLTETSKVGLLGGLKKAVKAVGKVGVVKAVGKAVKSVAKSPIVQVAFPPAAIAVHTTSRALGGKGVIPGPLGKVVDIGTAVAVKKGAPAAGLGSTAQKAKAMAQTATKNLAAVKAANKAKAAVNTARAAANQSKPAPAKATAALVSTAKAAAKKATTTAKPKTASGGLSSLLKNAVQNVKLTAQAATAKALAEKAKTQPLTPAQVKGRALLEANLAKAKAKAAATKAKAAAAAAKKPVATKTVAKVTPKAATALASATTALNKLAKGKLSAQAALAAKNTVKKGEAAQKLVALAKKPVTKEKAKVMVKNAERAVEILKKTAPAIATNLVEANKARDFVRNIAEEAEAGNPDAEAAKAVLLRAKQMQDEISRANQAGLPGLVLDNRGRVLQAPKGLWLRVTSSPAGGQLLYQGPGEAPLPGTFEAVSGVPKTKRPRVDDPDAEERERRKRERARVRAKLNLAQIRHHLANAQTRVRGEVPPMSYFPPIDHTHDVPEELAEHYLVGCPPAAEVAGLPWYTLTRASLSTPVGRRRFTEALNRLTPKVRRRVLGRMRGVLAQAAVGAYGQDPNQLQGPVYPVRHPADANVGSSLVAAVAGQARGAWPSVGCGPSKVSGAGTAASLLTP